MKRVIFIFLLLSSLVWSISAENRALLVGIGKYDTRKTGWSVIHGDNDVDLIASALKNHGFKSENVKTIKNNQATKACIVAALKNLAVQCKPGDNVFFLFSGHGQPISDLNGDEKKKPFDESIVPYDACRTRRYKTGSNFYNGEKHLIDDELNVLLDGIKKKLGGKGCLFVAFDACYSEGLEMAKSMIEQGDVKKIGPIRGTADILKISRDSRVAKISLPKDFSKGAKMVVVSACRDNERNYEYLEPTTRRFYGSLSYCLKNLIELGLGIKKWGQFFKDEKFREWDIFMSKQHPTISIYN